MGHVEGITSYSTLVTRAVDQQHQHRFQHLDARSSRPLSSLTTD